MRAKSMGLIWIVVKDFKKAIQFYTEVIGLKLMEMNEQWGWAELEGYEGGARLGIAQQQHQSDEVVHPGQNSVMTFTVDNLEKATQDLLKQGANLIGDVQLVPGQVKLQMVKDTEGNHFQLVELLRGTDMCRSVKDEHMSGCCGH